jgi:nuclear pore complex protein Nup133
MQTCFVWQHAQVRYGLHLLADCLKFVAQAVKGTPTCYIFSCPQDEDQPGLPLHCLIPYGATREPGLILISTSGTIRVWGSIAIGLAGGEHYSTIQLSLPNDEHITNLVRADVCLLHSYADVANCPSNRLAHMLPRRHPAVCFASLLLLLPATIT